jgi:hypothetical protein
MSFGEESPSPRVREVQAVTIRLDVAVAYLILRLA